MSSNQDPNVQQVMYQQAGYAGYQTTGNNSMGTWGQAQPQAVSYAIPYHGEVGSYAEKNAYNSGYPPVQYSGANGDGEYYRSQYAQATPYSHAQPTAQWSQQTAYQNATGYAGQQIYGTYSGFQDQRDAVQGPAFNPGAPPPNMNRPPPMLKRENGDNTFQASLSILENPAQTAAAYTASWVSSTSSIPPDLKDEPDFTMQRDDLAMFSSNFTDQFNNMGILYHKKKEIGQWDNKPALHSQQWPGLGQQDDSGRNKKHDRDRRPREDARELTWDERLRKAQVQKERVEQRGVGEKNERFDQNDRMRGSLRGRGGRGGFGRGVDGRDGRSRDNENERYMQNGVNDGSGRGAFRGRGGLTNNRGMGHPIVTPMNPMFQGQPNMMFPPRGPPFMQGPPPPPPPHVLNVPQDERFKNTWLDANVMYQPFHLPFAPIPYGMDNRFMGRGRGFGGSRGGRNNYGKKDAKKDADEKKQSADDTSASDESADKDNKEKENESASHDEGTGNKKENGESPKKENVEESS